MRKINLFLVVISVVIISGCVTGSKTVKPSSSEAVKHVPVIEEKKVSETPITVSQDPVEPAIHTPSQVVGYPSMPQPIRQPVKMQYSQIANIVSEFIDMKEKSDVPGESRYVGVSENKLTILEIKGDKDDVKEASMKLVYPKGIDKTSAELNNAMMSRFLRNIAPEILDWHNRVETILNKFSSLGTGSEGISEENIPLSYKSIKILCDKNADYIVVTLKTQP